MFKGNHTAEVTEMFIYPVKGLNGLPQSTVGVFENGNIIGDRVSTLLHAQADKSSIFRWAKHGEKLPNGILPSDFQVTSNPCSATNRGFFLCYGGQSEYIDINSSQVSIIDQPFGLDRFQLVYNQNGNPDDHDAHGPTVVSEESIVEVGKWFGFSRAEIIARFRPNILISRAGADPFWEERELLGPLGTPFRFQVGEIILEGTNVCTRCRIPTLNQTTGEVQRDFMKIFMENKAKHITGEDQVKGQMMKPHSKNNQPFTYRFALNTQSVGEGTEGIVRVGDSILCVEK